MLRVALLICTVFAFNASRANADFSYPDQHPAPQLLAALAQGPASQFWADRNVTGCPQGVAVYQSATAGHDGWGTGGWCTVWLSDDLVSATTWEGHIREGLLVDVCTAVTHEVGHALNLPHAATGVMASGGKPSVKHGWAPYFCWRWARTTIESVMRAHGVPSRFYRRHLRPVSAAG